jgi:hypothetical protein
MRIGISVLTREGQSIWQNGLGQNVVFLAQLFRRLPFVESVLLIDVGAQAGLSNEVEAVCGGLRTATLAQAADAVDVIVEMEGALDNRWLDLMRSRGRKVVYYCCGQPYVAMVEPSIFSRPVAPTRPDRCDEVWLLPKDRLSIPMMRTLYRCPVHEVPYIWHPGFVEQRIAALAEHRVRFGYEANRVQGEGLRVAIFEPNISVVKACNVPMLICDEAYRIDKRSVKAMNVLNALHVKDHPTMLHFAGSLDLMRERRACFLGRHDVVGFMGQQADAVVAHQWGNDQNYSYLDALYGDYPLIHNSPWLAPAGYYYPGFDVEAGAQQLLAALREHDAGLEAYRARSRAVFDRVDPFSPQNLDAYARRLTALFDNDGRRSA